MLNLHGISALAKFEGVPEGGVLGPAGFTTWLNSLTVFLKDRGHGLGIGCAVPSVWKNITWRWQGAPDGDAVEQLLAGLRGHVPLPNPDSVQHNDALMASCLRAMDIAAPSRINLVLHADDPVIVCSSQGAAMAVLHDLARWAYAHKAAFHVGPEKTVVLLPDGDMDPRLVLPLIGAGPCPIQTKTRHKWLGLVWPANLDFASALESALQKGNQLVADIVSLLDSGGLPLCFALCLFDAKVEGSVRFGRWLLATAPGALDRYDAAYDRWACALLQSPPWRSAAIAHLELGWTLCGRHRAILDIAGRRARLWALPEGDIYGEVFIKSHAVPLSWARKSLSLLEERDIPDYPDAGCSSVKSYLSMVRSLLSSAAAAALWSSCSGHVVPFPFSLLSSGPSPLPAALLSVSLPWDALLGHRALCRLRAGTLDLAHVNGKKSRAKVRCCLFVTKRRGHLTSTCWVNAKSASDLSCAMLPSLSPQGSGLCGCLTCLLTRGSFQLLRVLR